ncbi:hypothetical protein KNO81_23110 [Paraburkholderia sediminicola]|nr:hypothetical protein [Paraburkholderia sediminicola]
MSARVQVSLRVAATPLRAFDVFTREIGRWWQALLASLRTEVQGAAPPR